MNETPSFLAARSAIVSIGFITGALFLAIVVAAVNNLQLVELSLLSLAWLLFVFCLFYLGLSLRKFGNNEVHAASLTVKKANLFMASGFLLLFVFVSMVLAEREPLYGVAFFLLSLVLLVLFFRFLKKTFKYS